MKAIHVSPIALLAAALFAALGGTACRGTDKASPNQEPAAQARKTLTLSHEPNPVVGSEVRVSAEGLPAGRTVDLVWHTVKGGWVIEDYYHFRGKKLTEINRSLGQEEVGQGGRLAAEFRIHVDTGG